MKPLVAAELISLNELLLLLCPVPSPLQNECKRARWFPLEGWMVG